MSVAVASVKKFINEPADVVKESLALNDLLSRLLHARHGDSGPDPARWELLLRRTLSQLASVREEARLRSRASHFAL